jgi:hypothetical protein
MLPSWKNEASYAYAASLNSNGKAWEYLRRNPKYQECWASYRELMEKLEDKYGQIQHWPKIQDDLELWFYDPPRNPEESYKEWLDRCSSAGLEPERERHRIGMARPWGLWELYDPSQLATGTEKFLPLVKPRIWDHAEDVAWPSADVERRQFAYIEINMRRSVRPQIREAEKLLLVWQKKWVKHGTLVRDPIKKPRPKNFVNHLRVLDAYAENEFVKSKTIRKDIAEVLCGKGKTTYDSDDGDDKDGRFVDELRKEAERYRDHDYWALASPL